MPRIIATVGLHGSASTWVFNMARELTIAALGQERVLALYADEVARIPDADGRTLVIKSHHGSAGLDAWLGQAGALVLLSIRDPRDAAISMAQRFDAPLAHAARRLETDCARMRHLLAAGHPLFRSEHRFFDDPQAARRLARLLDLDLEPGVVDAIASNYRTEAVRLFTQGFGDLPPERLVTSGSIVFDDVTQIHRTHIGDAASGKWRALDPAVQAELARRFEPFLAAWGYGP